MKKKPVKVNKPIIPAEESSMFQDAEDKTTIYNDNGTGYNIFTDDDSSMDIGG